MPKNKHNACAHNGLKYSRRYQSVEKAIRVCGRLQGATTRRETEKWVNTNTTHIEAIENDGDGNAGIRLRDA